MNRFLIITCMQRFMTSCTLQTNPHITRYVHYKMKIIKLWFVYTKWFLCICIPYANVYHYDCNLTARVREI